MPRGLLAHSFRSSAPDGLSPGLFAVLVVPRGSRAQAPTAYCGTELSGMPGVLGPARLRGPWRLGQCVWGALPLGVTVCFRWALAPPIPQCPTVLGPPTVPMALEMRLLVLWSPVRLLLRSHVVAEIRLVAETPRGC